MVNPESLGVGDLIELPGGRLIRVNQIAGDMVWFADLAGKLLAGPTPMYGTSSKVFFDACHMSASAHRVGGGPQVERPESKWVNQTHGDQTSIPGLSPDTPTAVNAAGGKQSAVPYRADLIPARAILQVSAVLHTGALKYGHDNWHVIPTRDHLNHALTHVFAHLAGDAQDDHLGHAATRLLMALEIEARTTGNNVHAEKDSIH